MPVYDYFSCGSSDSGFSSLPPEYQFVAWMYKLTHKKEIRAFKYRQKQKQHKIDLRTKVKFIINKKAKLNVLLGMLKLKVERIKKRLNKEKAKKDKIKEYQRELGKTDKRKEQLRQANIKFKATHNMKEYRKEIYNKNKEKYKAKRKKYYVENKDNMKKYSKKYREINKEEIAMKKKKYYAANKERLLAQKREMRKRGLWK